LYNNRKKQGPARLNVQNFDFKVEYRPGSTNPADYNSRHPILDDASRESEEESTEIYNNN